MMAARRLDLMPDAPPLAAIPSPPAEDPAVLAARELLDLARAERDRALAELAAAEAALAERDDDGAADLLDALAAGSDAAALAEDQLEAALAQARRRFGRTERAVELAQERYQEGLALARSSFAEKMKPLYLAMQAEIYEKLRPALEINDRLRELAEYGRAHEQRLPQPSDVHFVLPTVAFLDELRRWRQDILNPPAPVPDLSRVAVRMAASEMPYTKGELVGLTEGDAILWCKAGLCWPVKPEDVRRLGLDRLVKFDGPTTVRFIKNWTSRQGAIVPVGSVQTLPPDIAARVVNLEFAELVK